MYVGCYSNKVAALNYTKVLQCHVQYIQLRPGNLELYMYVQVYITVCTHMTWWPEILAGIVLDRLNSKGVCIGTPASRG